MSDFNILINYYYLFAQADWYYMNTVKAWVAIGHMIAIIDINSVENNVPAQIVLAHQKLYVCKCNPPHPLFFAHYTNIF